MTALPGYSVDVTLIKCIKCGEEKPISEYSQMKYESGNEDSEVKRTCKTCVNKARKLIEELRKQHPAPPITEKCPCCGNTLKDLKDKNPSTKVFNSWRLHNDHETGKFLGYVCHICNTGMGNFKDSPEKMRKAADWLESVLKD